MRKKTSSALIILLFSACMSIAASAFENEGRQSAPKVWIKSHQKIYFKQSSKSKPCLVLQARRHEGFTDPVLSPNGEWLIVLSTYPFDVVKSRVEQYKLLVEVKTGKRIYAHEFGKKFAVLETVLDFEWIGDKPASLIIETKERSQMELDLTKTGK